MCQTRTQIYGHIAYAQFKTFLSPLTLPVAIAHPQDISRYQGRLKAWSQLSIRISLHFGLLPPARLRSVAFQRVARFQGRGEAQRFQPRGLKRGTMASMAQPGP